MAEFLGNAITIILVFWVIILSERIEVMESAAFAAKETGLFMAKEIDRLKARVAELEKDGNGNGCS